MTPQPPAPSEGSSLPPRHRPLLGSFNQDTTELDLWAFDDEDESAAAPEASPVVAPVPRSFGKSLPAPREASLDKLDAAGNVQMSKQSSGEESIRINVNKPQLKNRPTGSAVQAATPEGEFDDLESWDPQPLAAPSPPPPAAVAPVFVPAPPPEPLAAEGPPAPAPAGPADDNEFAPVVPAHAVPLSLRPHLRLSMLERIGLVGLLALLLVGGGAILVFSLTRLPTEARRAKANDFPIQGEHLGIRSATSYWRAPILTGPSSDTVRRGTQLLPVLEIAVSGGPAALRILFRNEDRAVVGDAVTRMVTSAGTLQIPATAGFDDLGMHAAYRTGESKPWTIEVLEAPSEQTTGREFKKLFELNISTDRR